MMIIIIIRALALNMMQQPFKWYSPTTALIRFLSEDIYFKKVNKRIILECMLIMRMRMLIVMMMLMTNNDEIDI